MKRKTMILGVVATLCFLSTAYNVWELQNEYDKQDAEWNEGVKVAFEEALWMEVDKRSEIPVYRVLNGEKGVATLNGIIPDSVFIFNKKYLIQDGLCMDIVLNLGKASLLSCCECIF